MAINTNLEPQLSKTGKYGAKQVECGPNLAQKSVPIEPGGICMRQKQNVSVNIATTTKTLFADYKSRVGKFI